MTSSRFIFRLPVSEMSLPPEAATNFTFDVMNFGGWAALLVQTFSKSTDRVTVATGAVWGVVSSASFFFEPHAASSVSSVRASVASFSLCDVFISS